MKQVSFAFLFLALFVACGYSKELNGNTTPHPIPELEVRGKPAVPPGMKVLKPVRLVFSQNVETPQLNMMQVQGDGANFSQFRKLFGFPTQGTGWVSLENVDLKFANCAGQAEVQPHFYLQSDHRTTVELTQGQKSPVVLEHLYVIRVEFDNTAQCADATLQFAVVYGE